MGGIVVGRGLAWRSCCVGRGFGKLEYVGGGDALSGLDKVLAGQMRSAHLADRWFKGRLGGVCCRECWVAG